MPPPILALLAPSTGPERGALYALTGLMAVIDPPPSRGWV